MLIDIASDLHVDFYPWLREVTEKDTSSDPIFIDWSQYRTSESKILIVAGDVSNIAEQSGLALTDAVSSYEKVIFVDGNHEHYGWEDTSRRHHYHTHDENVAILKKACESIGVVYLTGDNEWLHDGVLFIGCNGWYDFGVTPEIPIHLIEGNWWNWSDSDIHFDGGAAIMPPMLAVTHMEALRKKVIEAQTRDDVKRIVVVTHTVPFSEGTPLKPWNPHWHRNTNFFVNTRMQAVIDADIERKIALWAYGHTHSPFDFQRGHVRCVCNPRGYPFENRDDRWRPIQVEV